MYDESQYVFTYDDTFAISEKGELVDTYKNYDFAVYGIQLIEDSLLVFWI